MTVGELKKHLACVDDDAEVALYLYEAEEGGYLNNAEPAALIKNANTHYCKGDSPLDPRYNNFAAQFPDKQVIWLVGG